MAFKRFLLYNSVSTFIWALALGLLGWFAGLGFYNLVVVYNNLRVGILFLMIFLIGIYSLNLVLKKWLLKKLNIGKKR